MKVPYLMAMLALFSMLNACGKKQEKVPVVVKPPVAVETAQATLSGLQEGIEVTGTLEPKFSVDVKTQIPGLVKQVYVMEWVRVRKGQPLARIDVAESEAQLKRAEAAIMSAKANLAQTRVASTRNERELARTIKLKEAGLATQQSVDDSRTEMEAAVVRIDAAKAQVRVAEEEAHQSAARQGKGLVTAPIDGIVAKREVNVGDLAGDAAASKPIFRIVDNRLLNLTVTVSSADSNRVKVGQKLEFHVDSMPDKAFSGVLMYINPELSTSDRSLKVIAEVRNNPEILKGGLFVKGTIITGNRNSVLQVPRSAIVGLDTTARKGTLFVITDGIAKVREIATAATNGEMIELVSGLKQGERYVVRGGFNLKDGDRVSVAGSR